MTPYDGLPGRNFWSPAVGKRDALEIGDLWTPKWHIDRTDPVATFGSCFAQHFGKALASRGYNWTDYEPPIEGLSPESVAAFNFGVFSARTGNIYTVSMLAQWLDWATGVSEPPGEVWVKDGQFYDPFRPAIEPDGFDSSREVRENRRITLKAFADSIARSKMFVFTMGLTEGWRNVAGYEYPMCPGTAAGTFDPACHQFVNAQYPAIRANLEATIAKMHAINPDLRILLTVSPVPLTATASDQHVLVATTWSKSTLRAVAGDVAASDDRVDYFPSYEIITAPPFEGRFFAANKRSVLPEGVDHVMKTFFAGQGDLGDAATPEATDRGAAAEGEVDQDADDLVCEEALLNAFAPRE